jgi:two-component sensor histidine kinase
LKSEDSTTALESRRADGAADLRLAADKARLEETVRTQNALLTAAAHDLKNSLAAIRVRADLLLGQLDDDNQAPGEEESLSFRNGLARILATSAHMARLLDELLGLARMQAGHPLELLREPMDLVALAQRVVGEYLESPDHARIHLVTTETEMTGSWDPWRLERVLRNLLSNAVKFSPDGGEISVRLGTDHAASGDWVVLTVADQGLGIPEPDLDFVFERFYRGANVRGRIAGSGIGLAGARQIVLEHGGSLTVDSRESVGSTFTVRLPVIGPGSSHAPAGPAGADSAAVFALLSEISLLEPIPAAALARLAEQSTIRRFAAGVHVVQQGEVSESLFLVVRGRVRAERSSGPGIEPVILGEIGGGEVIGEMGALDRERRSATVVALEETLTVEIPASVLVGILLRYHEVGAALLRTLTRRLRTTDDFVAPLIGSL